MIDDWDGPYRRPPVRPAPGPAEYIEWILRDIQRRYGAHVLHMAVGRVVLRLTRDQLARRLPAFYPNEPSPRRYGMYASDMATASGRGRFERALNHAEQVFRERLRERGLACEHAYASRRTSATIRQVADALRVQLDPRCEQCQIPLRPRRRGRPRRYCSDACRRLAWRTANAARAKSSGGE